MRVSILQLYLPSVLHYFLSKEESMSIDRRISSNQYFFILNLGIFQLKLLSQRRIQRCQSVYCFISFLLIKLNITSAWSSNHKSTSRSVKVKEQLAESKEKILWNSGTPLMIMSFFQLISSIALVPISSDSIWSKGGIREHPPVTNCCACALPTSYSLQCSLCLVLHCFQWWLSDTSLERDDRPYDQSVIEKTFHQ